LKLKIKNEGYYDPPVAGLDHHVPSSNPIFKFSANKKNGVSFLKAQSSLFCRETLHAFACEKMAEKHMMA
jgi:hypothetical protein